MNSRLTLTDNSKEHRHWICTLPTAKQTGFYFETEHGTAFIGVTVDNGKTTFRFGSYARKMQNYKEYGERTFTQRGEPLAVMNFGFNKPEIKSGKVSYAKYGCVRPRWNAG
jgi:hypothetical protein